ncbi:hypothetical protein LEMLEM_LOCUS25862 [Lemmus lemmus]
MVFTGSFQDLLVLICCHWTSVLSLKTARDSMNVILWSA